MLNSSVCNTMYLCDLAFYELALGIEVLSQK